MNRIRSPFLLYVLFIITGATGLILQVAWKRDLTLIFGASHQAAAVVLAAFMGGLALGAWVWGRWAERVPRPLRWYGIAEIAVAGFALLLPLLLWGVDSVYILAAQSLEPTSSLLTGLRVVLCMLVLFIPTFFMGGTLPLLVRTLTHQRENFSSRLAWLYGMNTLGAVCGTLLAGFYLLPALGVNRTEWVAILVNLLVGVCALMMDRSSKPTTKPIRSSTDMDEQNYSPLVLRMVFYGTALCGFCALAFEVLWTRALSIALGTTTYSFTMMLATFLTGIALGGMLYRSKKLQAVPLPWLFAGVLGGLAVTSTIACQWVPSVPEWSLAINQMVYGHFSGVRPITAFLLCFAVMLVPATLFGLAFPLAARAHSILTRQIGSAAGDSVSYNTVGAMLGALSAGFWMIPTLGMQTSMLVLSAAPGIYAVVVGWVALPDARRSALVQTSLAGALVIVLLMPAVLPRWDIHRLGTFRNNAGETYLANEGQLDLGDLRAFSTLRYYNEGRGSTVSVTQSSVMQAILIDGKTVATDSQQGLGLQKMMGHIPSLLHPDPQTSLVIGLGAGVTLGACTIHPSVESVRVVEIEPAVVDGAATFGPVNNHALDNPRVDVVIQDGRNYLRTTNETYDIITADPIHPWAAGSTYLFTREYYQDARDRLNEGGLMCQWLPLYELSLANIQTMAGSFLEVFPHVQVWQIYNDAIMVGSMQPIVVSHDAIAEALQNNEVADDLRMIDVVDTLSMLALYVADEENLRPFCAEATINTDDNLHLEYATPYNVGTNTLPETIGALQPIRSFPPLDDGSDAVREEVRVAQSVERDLQLFLIDFDTTARCSEDAVQALEAILQPMPGFARVRRVLSQVHLRCGGDLAQRGQLAEAKEKFRKAIEVFPENGQAYSQLATLVARSGDLDDAVAWTELAVTHAPRSADAWINRGAILQAAESDSLAEQAYLEAWQVRPGYWLAAQHLGRLYAELDRNAEAREMLQQALAFNPGAVVASIELARVLMQQGETDEALIVLHDAEQQSPTHPGVLRELVDTYRQMGDVARVSAYETRLRAVRR